MKLVAAGLMAFLGLALVMSENQAGEKAKFTISEVMLKAHKGGLLKKVVSGKADDDEKKQLAELYTALSKNTPPKGDEKEFQKIATDMAKAAKVAAGDDEEAAKKAAKTLLKIVNCKVCHGKFK